MNCFVFADYGLNLAFHIVSGIGGASVINSWERGWGVGRRVCALMLCTKVKRVGISRIEVTNPKEKRREKRKKTPFKKRKEVEKKRAEAKHKIKEREKEKEKKN